MADVSAVLQFPGIAIMGGGKKDAVCNSITCIFNPIFNIQ